MPAGPGHRAAIAPEPARRVRSSGRRRPAQEVHPRARSSAMTEPTAGIAVQNVACSGLDALLGAVPVDLCAYLHVGQQLGPQLYLRRPTLAALDPADAFRLFSALRDQLEDAPDGESRMKIDAFDAFVVASAGTPSRGLWVAGRRDDALTDADASTAAALGRAIMQVCHTAESASVAHTPSVVLRVAVETMATGMRATVTVEHEGAERIGHGDAAAALPAVAWGPLDALAPSLKLVAAAEDGIDDERVVLVLVRDAAGRSSVGAALVGSDPLRAAASAALVAATALG